MTNPGAEDEFFYDSFTERELQILRLKAERRTNREIASELFLALSTIKWYVTQIYSKLNVSNRREAVKRARELGLLDEQPLPLKPVNHNLPAQTTPFVGREDDLAALATHLHEPDTRLITILGLGGMGKTRLALAIAEGQAGRFADGVHYVPLQPLTDSDQVVSQIAASLDFQFSPDSRDPKQQLLDYLAGKQMLLLMDNWEHLLEGGTLLTEVLQSAPNATILATSREKLNLTVEMVFSLGSMETPPDESASDTLEYDAVQLFVQTAQRIRPDWAVAADELHDLGQVCRLTEGMPLGIVLAASWVDMLSLGEIATEIQQSLDFLETDMRDMPERLRSVRAVFEHTWRRLSAAERQVFMKLSVFRGGCTREAAEAVTGASLRTLHRLVDKALLSRDEAGRYDLHELLRQFGEEQLEKSDAAEFVREAHSHYYLRFLADLEADIKGRRQFGALDDIERDFDNIQVSWHWALDQQDFGPLHPPTKSLTMFCLWRNREPEGYSLIKQAADALPATPDYEPLWAFLIAWGEWLVPKGERSIDNLTRCLSIVRQHDNQADIAFCLFMLGNIEVHVHRDYRKALDRYEQSLALYQTLDDAFHIGGSFFLVAWGNWMLGEIDIALTYLRQSAALQRETGNEWGIAYALNFLGIVCIYDPVRDLQAEGIRYLQEAIEILRRGNFRARLVFAVGLLGWAYFLVGDFRQARLQTVEAQRLGTENFRSNYGTTLSLLGMLAIVAGDYATGARYCEAALETYLKHSTPEHPIARGGLEMALCGLERIDEAGSHLHAIFQSAWVRSGANILGPGCATLALVLYNRQEFVPATHYLSFVLSKDHKAFGWAKRWSLLQDLRENLSAELDEVTFEAAWAEGQAMTVEDAVAYALEEETT